MPKVSKWRKVEIASQIAGRHLKASRLGGAVLRGARSVLGSFSRVLHHLWLEVTGFVFLVLAAIGATAGFREYTKYQSGETGLGRVVLAACFTLTFVWFGVTSFWRVRKKG